jgi:hypothetical protein
MAKYTPKTARERGARFVNSWKENSPAKDWAEMTFAEFKAKKTAIEAKEDEIEASRAHTKSLEIERDNMNTAFMQDCDYVAADVEGDRNFGPDSALYGGFGYIRKSLKKKGGRKPNGETNKPA